MDDTTQYDGDDYLANASDPAVAVDADLVAKPDGYDGGVTTELPPDELLFEDGELRAADEVEGYDGDDDGDVLADLDDPFDDPVAGSRNDELNPY